MIKIKKYSLSATIPVGQYANIQPTIEIECDKVQEAQEVALTHVNELFDKYSDQGLKEREIQETVKLKSFNEGVEIDFDNINHIYTINSKRLFSASSFVAKHSSKFDAKIISRNCEKAWKVPSNTIQDMWKSNGRLSADFGTVVHKALEYYFNYKEAGAKISDAKDMEDNYAMPKHPFLKSVIEGLEKVYTHEGKIYHEAFVTDVETLRCGQVDVLQVLDEKKKICSIVDYKVNVSAEEESSKGKLLEPFNKLPKNKLSKYQIQMSFYADMLIKSGWTVQSTIALVYEDGWKRYDLDILKI